MDKNSHKYTASDDRGGFSHPFRPNSLPIPDRSGNYNHLFSSRYQKFEKEKLCSGISNSSNGFGEYILGDPMLVDQSILQRTYLHDRPKIFSPQFEGDFHCDQHQPFSSRYIQYSNDKSFAQDTDVRDLSPAYLNASPLFPQFQQPLVNQEGTSPFRFESSQMLDVSPHLRPPYDLTHLHYRNNPSPLFHPSTRKLPTELGTSPPNNVSFFGNKVHDSFVGLQQGRESVLHMRKTNENEFTDLASTAFANEYNQQKPLMSDFSKEFNQFKKTNDAHNHNRNGLQILQKQLLSNLPVHENVQKKYNDLGIPSEFKVHSGKDSIISTNLKLPQSKLNDSPSCIHGINSQNNGAIVIKDMDLCDITTSHSKTTFQEIQKRNSAQQRLNTVLYSEDSQVKNRLIKNGDQAHDNLKTKMKMQILEADALLKHQASNKVNLMVDKQIVKENKIIKSPDSTRESSNSPCVKILGEDLMESLKQDSRAKKDIMHLNKNGRDFSQSLKDEFQRENLSDLHENETFFNTDHSEMVVIEECKYNEMSCEIGYNRSPVQQQLEHHNQIEYNTFILENEVLTKETSQKEKNHISQSDESQNEPSEKGNRNSSELTREERAIQYAMQKFMEMENKQKNKFNRKRLSQHRRKKELIENSAENSDAHENNHGIERKRIKANDDVISTKEISKFSDLIPCDLPTTSQYNNKRGLSKQGGIISKNKKPLERKEFVASKNTKKTMHLKENVKGQISKMTSLDEKDSKTQSKADLQQKSYLLVPSYRGFKDFSPILLEGRTRKKSTQADTEKIGKPKFPILVVEQVGEKKNEILVRENEDLDAKLARESLLAENVYDESGFHLQDNKSRTNVRQLSCNRMTGETVLHKAARLGYDDIVAIKIKEGADVNARDNAGWTALHEACSRGMTDVVKVLLKYGADPNSCSDSGIRPIHDAVDSDNLEVIRLLLSYGADVSTETYSGLKILQLARTESTRDYITDYAKDIQEISVLGNVEDCSKNLWNFRGSSYIFDGSKDDADDVLSNFPGDSDRLIEFEASKTPFPPCYNLPVYNEAHNIVGYRNYYILQDVLKATGNSRQVLVKKHKVELREMPLAEFLQNAVTSQVSYRPEVGHNEDHTQIVELVHLGPFTSRKIFGLKVFTV